MEDNTICDICGNISCSGYGELYSGPLPQNDICDDCKEAIKLAKEQAIYLKKINND